MSMMGSGIYSEEVTVELVCRERCSDCPDNKPCDNIWKEDLHTDDWGNIDQQVKCNKCEHSYYFKQERE